MDNCCNSTNVNINLKGFAPCRRPLSELMTGDLPHRLRTNVWEWVVTGWGGDGEVTGWSRLVMGWCEGAGFKTCGKRDPLRHFDITMAPWSIIWTPFGCFGAPF